ncbi:MAG: hypothetical protein HY291_11660 [Planctomycetes bacterium]|nr:hypothetical protein [Planctomycetota bacterium]
MITAGHAACPYCGLDFNIPFGESSDSLACPSCGRTVSILAHKSGRLKALPAEPIGRPPTGRFSTNTAQVRPGSGRFANAGEPKPDSGRYAVPAADTRPGSARLEPPKTTPMPMRRRAEGVDEAMLSEARGLFEKWGWPSRDWEGRKAFAALVTLDGAGRERPECINVTVFAHKGVLGFETVVGPLPEPPWMPLREALNRLNSRSGGSIFLIRECGVVARYKMLQRNPPFNVLAPDHVMRSVRQLNLDRKAAAPFIDPDALAAMESAAGADLGALKPAVVPGLASLSLKHLADLAEEAEYNTLAKSGLLYISREPCDLIECKVWMNLSGGVLRGWAIPGKDLEIQHPGEHWNFFRKMAGLFRSAPVKLTRAQVDHLLERLNAANELPRILSYVWNGERVLAEAVYPHADRHMDADEFRQIAEKLMEFADLGEVETPAIRQAV